MGNVWRGSESEVRPFGSRRAGWAVGAAVGALAVGLFVPETSALAAGPTLAPHEAVYDLSLSRAQAGGVVGANGLMNYKLENTCAGWTMESRTVLNLFYAEGGRMETEWEFVAYEGKNGEDYSFYIRNSRNGQVDEILEGDAQMDGKGGKAHYKRPEDNTVALPEATLFPSAHTLAIIRAAQEGQRFVAKTVFDGASKGGAGLVTAFIGKELGADTVPDSADPLLKTPSWPMTIAFFSPKKGNDGEEGTGVPSYEVKVRYHDNGVAQEMEQNFGFFSLDSKLKTLKALPEPDC